MIEELLCTYTTFSTISEGSFTLSLETDAGDHRCAKRDTCATDDVSTILQHTVATLPTVIMHRVQNPGVSQNPSQPLVCMRKCVSVWSASAPMCSQV